MHHDLQKFPTTFLDYSFKLTEDDSIIFDDELRPEHLRVQHGDTFEVIIQSGKIEFKKINGSG